MYLDGYQPKELTKFFELDIDTMEKVILDKGTPRVMTEEEYQAYLKSLEPTTAQKVDALLAEIGDKEAQKQALRDKLTELEGEA